MPFDKLLLVNNGSTADGGVTHNSEVLPSSRETQESSVHMSPNAVACQSIPIVLSSTALGSSAVSGSAPVSRSSSASASASASGISSTSDGSSGSIDTSNTNNSRIASTTPGPSGFAAARAELDQMEDESKFEKFGRKITKLLKDELHAIKKNNKMQETKLYSYQIQAVLNVKDHFEQDRDEEQGQLEAALIVAPPGSGKSGMVTLIPYALESSKVLILTPSKIISKQLAADFGYPDMTLTFMQKVAMLETAVQARKWLEPVTLAVTQRDVDTMTASNLVIANSHKFGGRAAHSLSQNTKTPEQIRKVEDQLKQFDTVIVDEAHHYPAPTWMSVVNIFTGKKVIFLTATPYRGDERMENILEGRLKTVYEIESRELIGKTIREIEFVEKKMESDEVETPEEQNVKKIKLDGVKRKQKKMEVENPNFLAYLSNDIKDCLAKHNLQEPRVAQSGKFHQAIVLVTTKIEAKAVAIGLGDRATFVTSEKGGEENLEKFTKGGYQIAVVCGMLREGYDNAYVSLVVILRNCKSRVLFEQFCGRSMRVIRDLKGVKIDRTIGTVLTYEQFAQRGLWEQRLKIAEEDPVEEDEDNDGGSIIIETSN